MRFHLADGVDHVHPEYQSTVLVAAITTRHEDVALMLLEHGASTTARSALDDLTPLEAARATGLGAVEARLLELGVQPPRAAAASRPPRRRRRPYR